MSDLQRLDHYALAKDASVQVAHGSELGRRDEHPNGGRLELWVRGETLIRRLAWLCSSAAFAEVKDETSERLR